MKLLFIDCCVRGQGQSRTRYLCDHFLKEVCELNPQIQVQTIFLYQEPISSLNNQQLLLREQLIQQQEWESPLFQYAHDFANADYILIGAPYWDLSFPSCLKTYIEHTSINGIAFTYTEAGCIGLCKSKKMMYLSTAGGFLSGIHAGEEYMRQICNMYGIEVFESYCLEGLDIWGTDVDEKLKNAEKYIKNLAARWITS